MIRLLIFASLFSFNINASLIEEEIIVDEKSLLTLQKVPVEYEVIVEKIQKLFYEELHRDQATLKVNYFLKSSTVNASASREGNEWRINFYGGLLKHKAFDLDIFSVFLCHELGHHLAGSPFKFYPDSQWSWISAEGQADYFVTNICLKRLLSDEDNAFYLNEKSIPNEADIGCNQKFTDYSERSLCIRSTVMSQKMALFLHSLKRSRRAPKPKLPVLSGPDTTTVVSTYTMHPSPQCRLDTFFQGALCTLHSLNCPQGEGKYSGARPRCWYFPEY